MSLVVVVLLAALGVGLLRGGSLRRLESLVLRRPALVAGALAAQAAGTLIGGPVHPAGLVVSAVLVVAFLAANRGVRGTGLVALGLAANALVVALNGAMPVSPQAAARAGVDPLELLDSRHELAAARTRLPVLADVVPVPLPLRPEVVSAGDVLVAAGLAQLLVVGMGGGRGPRSAPSVRPVMRSRVVRSRVVRSGLVSSTAVRPRPAPDPTPRPATPRTRPPSTTWSRRRSRTGGS